MDFSGQSVGGVALTWDSLDPSNDPQTFFGGTDLSDDEVHVVILRFAFDHYTLIVSEDNEASAPDQTFEKIDCDSNRHAVLLVGRWLFSDPLSSAGQAGLGQPSH